VPSPATKGNKLGDAASFAGWFELGHGALGQVAALAIASPGAPPTKWSVGAHFSNASRNAAKAAGAPTAGAGVQRWLQRVGSLTTGVPEILEGSPGGGVGSGLRYSSTLTDPRWANTTVLSGDVAADVRELKAKPAGELQVHGSGALFRWLLDNDLVDEIILLTYPVVVGQGTRLFPVTGPDIALDLVDSRATPKGVTIQVYRPAGRPQYATD
jgi:hypothetical protein